MKILEDKNFDSLIDRFERRVYDTAKGDWRLKLLTEDLRDFFQPAPPLTVWDAGCGLAQISVELAAQGHQVTLCDVSEKMLAKASDRFRQRGLAAEFHHQAAQALAPSLPPFDLVLCHAVLEWLAEPIKTLAVIADRVKPGGTLSLLFYNRNAMVYTNVLRGGWRWRDLLTDRFIGRGDKLTPPHPQYPHEIVEALRHWGFTLSAHTGIRVFHDYLDRSVLDQNNAAELFELEYRYCRMPAYRDMGRYVHLMGRKN